MESIKVYNITSAQGFLSSRNDAYTVLLMHMDEADTGTDFDDSSASAHVTTASGSAQCDTAQAKFGVSSGLFDGNGDYVTVDHSADFAMGSGAFTIDGWFMANDFDPVTLEGICGQSDDSENQWNFGWASTAIVFRVLVANSYSINFNQTVTLEPAIWYHLALIRGWGGDTDMFAITVDGKVVGTLSNSSTIPDLAADLTIGRVSVAAATKDFAGWMDEFRISKGIARWTADFTPPTFHYI